MTKIKWYVYILRCADDSLYTGMTTDPVRRVLEHNKSSRGSKFVKYRRPVALVYSEQYKAKSQALKRENEIKSWSRDKKLKLISSMDQIQQN